MHHSLNFVKNNVIEDPYWTGEYAKYYTLGMPNGSSSSKYHDPNYYLVICTLNIFDAYSLENYNGTTRHNFNAIISDYMFNDTYLPHLKLVSLKVELK